MYEIKSKTLILVTIFAILISLSGTLIALTRISHYENVKPITGYAPSDTGYVNITILGILNIDVDTFNDSIDFGVCSLPPAPNLVSINSSMTESELNSTIPYVNCSNSNLPAFIRVMNIGSVDVIINISTNIEANGSTGFLGSENASMAFAAREVNPGDCTGLLSENWTEIRHRGIEEIVCTQLTFGWPLPSVKLYFNLTIPYDATTDGTQATSILTFTGVEN